MNQPDTSKSPVRAAPENGFITEGAVTAITDHLAANVIVLGYALMLGATTFQIGLLATARTAGASLQLVADGLVRRLGTRKRVGIVSLVFASVVRLILGLLPVATLWFAADTLPWALLAGILVIHAAGQIGGVIRLSWIADLVPARTRGQFLGNRDFAIMLVGSTLGVAAAWFVDWQQVAFPEYGPLSAQGLFVAAAVMAVFSIAVLKRIPEPTPVIEKPGGRMKFVLDPFRDARFRPLMVSHLVRSFATPIAATFFNLYLITVLHMPLGVVAIYSFIGQVSGLYTVRLWGRLADRFGNMPVLLVCVFFKSVFPIMWILMWPVEGGPQKLMLYLVVAWVHMWRGFNTGENIGRTNLVISLAPEGEVTRYLSSFRTLGNWMQAIVPAFAGLMASALQDAGWSEHLSLCAMFALSGVGQAHQLRYSSARPRTRFGQRAADVRRAQARPRLHHRQRGDPVPAVLGRSHLVGAIGGARAVDPLPDAATREPRGE